MIKRFFALTICLLLVLSLVSCKKEEPETHDYTPEELYIRSVEMCAAIDKDGENAVYYDKLLGKTFSGFDLYDCAYITLHDLGDYKDAWDYFERFSYNSYAPLYIMDGRGPTEHRRFQKFLLAYLYDDNCELNGFQVLDGDRMEWYLATFYNIVSISGIDLTGTINITDTEDSYNWRLQSPYSEYSSATTNMKKDGQIAYTSELTCDGDWNDATYTYGDNYVAKKYWREGTWYTETTSYEDERITKVELSYNAQSIGTTYNYTEDGLLDTVVTINQKGETITHYCLYQGTRLRQIRTVERDEDRNFISSSRFTFVYGPIIGYVNDNA